MEFKEQLTNEKIRKKFASQFELVNYAIRLAENMIHTGRDPRVKIDSQNRSLQVLTEILSDKDRFDDIPVVDHEAQTFASKRQEEATQAAALEKSSERKRNRKILAE